MTDLPEIRSAERNTRASKYHLQCRVAVFSILLFPMIVAISMRASISSLELNKGNFSVRKKSRIMPADHMSIARAKLSKERVRLYQPRRTSRLQPAFQQHLRGTEATSTSSVRFRMWPANVFNPLLQCATLSRTGYLFPGIRLVLKAAHS